jgi:hypothetical protein
MAISIKDLVPATRVVNLGRGDAPVYSLDVAQVANLLINHGEELNAFFTEGAKPDFAALLAVMPSVAMQLIAMGLRAEGQEEDVKSIPLASQVEVLINVWELSVPDLGKLKARLSELVGNVKSQNAQASLLP